MHTSDLLVVLVCQPTYSAWLVCHSVGVSTDLCFDDVSICVKKGTSLQAQLLRFELNGCNIVVQARGTHHTISLAKDALKKVTDMKHNSNAFCYTSSLKKKRKKRKNVIHAPFCISCPFRYLLYVLFPIDVLQPAPSPLLFE